MRCLVMFALALLTLGCSDPEADSQTDSDPVVEDSNRGSTASSLAIDPKDGAVAITVTTSFVDTGLKGIILEDGTGYAWQLRAGILKAVKFRIPLEEKTSLISTVAGSGFLALPKKLHNNDVTDGTETRIAIADSSRSHAVWNYMVEDQTFLATSKELSRVIEDHLDTGQPLEVETLRSELTDHFAKLTEESPKHDLFVRKLPDALPVPQKPVGVRSVHPVEGRPDDFASRLKWPVEAVFRQSPLQTAVEMIAEESGLDITVDEAALNAEKEASFQPVTLEAMSTVVSILTNLARNSSQLCVVVNQSDETVVITTRKVAGLPADGPALLTR